MGGFRYKYIRILSKFLSDCWLCPYSVSMKCLSLNKISTCSQYAPAIPVTISRHTNVQRKERGFLFPLLIFKSKKTYPLKLPGFILGAHERCGCLLWRTSCQIGLAGFLGVRESAQNWMGTSISSGPNCWNCSNAICLLSPAGQGLALGTCHFHASFQLCKSNLRSAFRFSVTSVLLFIFIPSHTLKDQTGSKRLSQKQEGESSQSWPENSYN